MRRLLGPILALAWAVGIMLIATSLRGAHARTHHHVSHAPVHSIWGECAEAARLGGPCGCIAMRIVGLTDRSLWSVSEWLRFPGTDAHPGAAAIWPGRHVEIVTAVYEHDGQRVFDSQGSVGFHGHPISAVIFRDPRGRFAQIEAPDDDGPGSPDDDEEGDRT